MKESRFEGAEKSPGFLLWQVSTFWRREVESALKEVGLTHPQFVLLAGLGWHKSQGAKLSQVELAHFCGLDVTMTSQVLRTLEKRGVIERHTELGNAKTKYPQLTPKGSKLLQKALPLVEEIDAQFFAPLNREMKGWLNALVKLVPSQKAPGV